MLAAAARSLLRQPSFLLGAAGTLAIGVAATTAVFTTVNAALLTPLPYARSQDLYTVRTFFPSGRFTIGLVASEEMGAAAALTDLVSGVAMTMRGDGAIEYGTGVRQAIAYGVSGDFFDLFGVPVLQGRALGKADAVRGAPRVVVLSHQLWTSALGGRPDVIGTTLLFGGGPARVVGVAPPDFDVPAGADLWFNTEIPTSIGHGYDGFLRARPGVNAALLQARMNDALARLGVKYPDQEVGRAFAIRPLLDATVGDLGPILVILFGATALLLVLAAANVTNLMLARTTTRAREIAIRAALGASRGRIVRGILGESVLIAVCGGIAGCAAAYALLRVLLASGGSRLPRLAETTIDARVLLFAAAVIALTGVLVGLLPALRLADTGIAAVMNESGRAVRGSRKTRRLLGMLVIAEIAVAVAIVAGAARLALSYRHLGTTPLGFEPHGRLVLDVLLPPPRRAPYAERQAWWDATQTRLRETGAIAAAAASSLPLGHEWDSTTFVDFVSRPDVPPDKRPNARLRVVTPEFFSVMGMPLKRGRGLTLDDRASTQPVGVVNEAFARRNLGGADPIGERIKGIRGHMENGRFVDDLLTIVGVVADAKYAAVMEAAEPVLYVPFSQSLTRRASIVLTTNDDVAAQSPSAFEAALRSVEPRVAIQTTTMERIVGRSLERQRLGTWLMAAFALIALILASVGVFGVIQYVVSQRLGEIAIRQALGATRRSVIAEMMNEGVLAAVVGAAVGLVLAWWSGRLLTRYVFEVSAANPLVLWGSATIVLVLAVSATLLPAFRAASADLTRGLRPE